jgi:hypothetical protein
MMRIFSCLLAYAVVATGYSPSNKPSVSAARMVKTEQHPFIAVAASAALAFILSVSPAGASTTAGQIEFNSIPPTSVNVDINDLPIVGKLLSGTYTKVADGSISKPSVTIKSPKDKVAAIKGATTGHLEFDVNGLVKTHVDVDVSADEAGVATVRVSSPLIPKVPFKNDATSTTKFGNKPSEWSLVTNLGNGKSYYYNEKTGVSTLEKP